MLFYCLNCIATMVITCVTHLYGNKHFSIVRQAVFTMSQ